MTAKAIPEIVVQRGGKRIVMPTQKPLTAGPDLAGLSNWFLAFRMQRTLRFQTPGGAVDVAPEFLSPEDGSGQSWNIFGQLYNRRPSGGDNNVFFALYFNFRDGRGHMHVSTDRYAWVATAARATGSVHKGPDSGRAALWISSHPAHSTLLFRADSGPFSFVPRFISPDVTGLDDTHGAVWRFYGQLPGVEPAQHVAVRFDFRSRKGNVGVSAQSFVTVRPRS